MKHATWVRVAFAAAVATATGCSLLTSFDGLSSGGPLPVGGDGGTDATSAGDAPSTADADAGASALTPRVWRQINVTGPPPRHSSRMVFDRARGKAVLFGGFGASTTSGSETWEWDGAAWAHVQPSLNPVGRGSPGLAYDEERHVTMLYAGAGTPPPEPWEFDGTTWKSSGASPTAPAIAYAAAMTYDSARKVLVIFGGLRAGANDEFVGTWEWSATGGFVDRKPPVMPPTRHGHVLVYDAARARTVLFGGSNGAFLGDVWEYDGNTWTEIKPPLAPSARVGACGAYDSVRKVVVVFGGRAADTKVSFDETWEWDGTTWRTGPPGPPARRSCAVAFDSARNAVVLYGGGFKRIGKLPTEALGDTWVYE